MAVTYQHTATGRYLISREFDTLAAAAKGAAALESVCERAFQPDPAFTGSTATVEFEADPLLQAMLDRADEDAPLEGLTAGTATGPDAYNAATAGQRETGE